MMKHEKSVIKIIRDKKSSTYDHIAVITGKRYAPRPVYYRNTETNEDYFAISGALEWPTYDRPGFAVIVAALKDDPKDPTFRVIQEIESVDIQALATACLQARYKWGYPYLLNFWYGDYLRFSTFLSDFNQACDRKNSDKGLYLSPPYDFDRPNRTEIYLKRIKSFLTPDEKGKKRLFLGQCEKLRSYLHNLPPNLRNQDTTTAPYGGQLKIEGFPAVGSLAYAVHSLANMRPWLRFIEPQKHANTIPEEELLARPLHEQLEIMRELNLLWEEDESINDRDDGGLISTLL